MRMKTKIKYTQEQVLALEYWRDAMCYRAGHYNESPNPIALSVDYRTPNGSLTLSEAEDGETVIIATGATLAEVQVCVAHFNCLLGHALYDDPDWGDEEYGFLKGLSKGLRYDWSSVKANYILRRLLDSDITFDLTVMEPMHVADAVCISNRYEWVTYAEYLRSSRTEFEFRVMPVPASCEDGPSVLRFEDMLTLTPEQLQSPHYGEIETFWKVYQE